MTKEKKLEILSARMDGLTYDEIERIYGVSQAGVKAFLKNPRSGPRLRNAVIYPNITKWMAENDVAMIEFAERINFGLTSVHKWLYGKAEPRKAAIDKILEVTGMTYEEAFATR